MSIKLRCYNPACRGPFGLTRRHSKGHAFCCQKCLDSWWESMAQEVKFLQLLSWFRPPDKPPPIILKPPD